MKIDVEEEKKEILRRYRGLLRAAKNSRTREERKAIRKAFDLALELHSCLHQATILSGSLLALTFVS